MWDNNINFHELILARGRDTLYRLEINALEEDPIDGD